MTTEALKSPSITNRDATPRVFNSAGFGGADKVQQKYDYLTTTSGKTVGSTYRICDVPSNCRVSSVSLQAAAMTQGAFDIGVYRNTDDGGAVVSAAFFGSAVDCSSAVAETVVTNESGTNTIVLQSQPLWQAAGLSSDPGGTLDIVATSTNTITVGALLSLKVTFVI